MGRAWMLPVVAALFLLPSVAAQNEVTIELTDAEEDPVVPLGTNRSLIVTFSTGCTDEDLQPMTSTEVAYWWQVPPAYIQITGEEITDSHAKEPLDCTDESTRIESTLALEVAVDATAPGLTPFDVVVFGVMNKTNALDQSATYGPATANLTLATGYRAGLDIVEIPTDRSAKPGNETTIRLRVFNLANAPARVVFEVEAVEVNGTALEVLSVPSPVDLEPATAANGSAADIEIPVRAPANVSGAGYDEFTVVLTATSTPVGATPFNETTVVERTYTVRVGGLAPDVYSPMTAPVTLLLAVLLVAVVLVRRRRGPGGPESF